MLPALLIAGDAMLAHYPGHSFVIDSVTTMVVATLVEFDGDPGSTLSGVLGMDSPDILGQYRIGAGTFGPYGSGLDPGI